MKVEHLASGSDDCPLIRLYDFNPVEAQWLRQITASLVTGDRHLVVLTEEKWVIAVDG